MHQILALILDNDLLNLIKRRYTDSQTSDTASNFSSGFYSHRCGIVLLMQLIAVGLSSSGIY